MFHFGMTWTEVMQMPVKAFWITNRNVGRLLSEMDVRALDVMVTAFSQNEEMFKKVRDNLVEQADRPLKTEPKLDRAGFNMLKKMGKDKIARTL